MSTKVEHSQRTPLTPGQVLARRIRSIRARRGMSQQDLADAVSAIGYQIHRLTLAKIEKGGTRAEKAPLQEILAIAAALGVAPVHLLVPLEDDARITITKDLVITAPLARDWIGGRRLLRPDDVEGFVAEMPRTELLAMLREWSLRQASPLVREIAEGEPSPEAEAMLSAAAAELQHPKEGKR